jgi:hypothetical protein
VHPADRPLDTAGHAYRPRYAVVAHAITEDAWHLAVAELPETWTVAFSADGSRTGHA